MKNVPENVPYPTTGARIDHGHHVGLPIKALFDVLALEDAVQVGLDLTDESDTLIIVTADHDHTMGIQGYTLRGSDIFGKYNRCARFARPGCPAVHRNRL